VKQMIPGTLTEMNRLRRAFDAKLSKIKREGSGHEERKLSKPGTLTRKDRGGEWLIEGKQRLAENGTQLKLTVA